MTNSVSQLFYPSKGNSVSCTWCNFWSCFLQDQGLHLMAFVGPFQLSTQYDSVVGLALYFHTDLVLTISLVVQGWFDSIFSHRSGSHHLPGGTHSSTCTGRWIQGETNLHELLWATTDTPSNLSMHLISNVLILSWKPGRGWEESVFQGSPHAWPLSPMDVQLLSQNSSLQCKNGVRLRWPPSSVQTLTPPSSTGVVSQSQLQRLTPKLSLCLWLSSQPQQLLIQSQVCWALAIITNICEMVLLIWLQHTKVEQSHFSVMNHRTWGLKRKLKSSFLYGSFSGPASPQRGEGFLLVH